MPADDCLSVQVVGPDGFALKGAECILSVAGNAKRSALTDARGTAQFALHKGAELLWVYVSLRNFSPRRIQLASRQAEFLEGHGIAVPIDLQPSGGLQVHVEEGSSKLPSSLHRVELQRIKDANGKPVVADVASGRIDALLAATDISGFTDWLDCLPGQWLVKTPEWRNAYGVEGVLVDVRLSEHVDVTLDVTSWPEDVYISGEITNAALGPDLFGESVDCRIYDTSTSDYYPLYSDGMFFVKKRPGVDIYSLSLWSVSKKKASRPFSMSALDKRRVISPVWDD